MINIVALKQKFGTCGPTSFKMVMDFYGVNKPLEYWKKSSGRDFIDEDTGKSEFGYFDDKFVESVKEFGFDGFCKDNSNVEEIKKYLEKSIPVIVDWFSPEEESHFSVVVGLDNDYIFIADPHFGEIKKYDLEWFLKRWSDHGLVPKDYPKNNPGWVHRICVVYPKTLN